MNGGIIRGLALAVLAAPLSGCGSSSTTPMTSTQMEDVRLRDVAELYREYQVSMKRPPASLKDLQTMGDAGAPTGFSAIRNGDVVVRWQATLPDTEPEPTSPRSVEVLAYTRDVPEKGGNVLMLDRRIRTMSAEEFKAAKLAGEGSSNSKRKVK
jgi:hypothetical protein